MGRYSTKSQIDAQKLTWQTKWDELNKNPTAFLVHGECNCDNCIEHRKTDAILEQFYSDVMPNLFWGGVPKLYLPDWIEEHREVRNVDLRNFPPNRADYIMAAAFSQARLNKDSIAKDPRVYCRCCGKLICRNDAVNTDEIGLICQECNHNFFPRCAICGVTETQSDYGLNEYSIRIFDADENCVKTDENVTMCPICVADTYSQCNNCSMFINNDAVYFVKHDNTVTRQRPAGFFNQFCPECIKNVFSTCVECGERGLTHNMHIIRLGDGEVGRCCNNCQMLHRDVLQYNQKPKPKYTVFNERKTPREDAPFFGVEFEVEMSDVDNCCSRRELARTVKEIIGTEYMYSKHDGSLLSIDGENGRGGLEIVTHPFSWKFYKNTNVFETLFRIIENEQWNAKSERCGNHIHITKNAFTSFHLFKFMRFFYNKRNRPFFKIMSARVNPDGEHCRRYCRWWREDAEMLKNVVVRKRNIVPDKHGAINLMNHETIEIRIFQGVDNMEDFSRNMEFVHSLIEFTKEASAKECMLSKWLEFVINHYNQYRHLLRYMYRRKKAFTSIYAEFKKFTSNKQLEAAVQKGE